MSEDMINIFLILFNIHSIYLISSKTEGKIIDFSRDNNQYMMRQHMLNHLLKIALQKINYLFKTILSFYLIYDS